MATPIQWLGQFEVNTGRADIPGTSDPQVTGLSNGNFLVAWVEASGTTGVGTPPGRDIIGKIYDGAGGVVRDGFRINDSRTSGEESDFDIAPTNDGGFMLVYTAKGGSNSSVIWERKNAAGDNIRSRELDEETGIGDFDNPQIAVSNVDNYSYVTYTNRDVTGFPNDDITGTRLDATGLTLRLPFDAGDNDTDDQIENDVAINTNGEMVSVYTHPNDGKVYVDVYSSFAALQHRATVDDDGTPNDPHVATLANGNIAVTWVDDADDVNFRIYDSNLNVVTWQTVIDSTGAKQPRIAALPEGEGSFVVVYDEDDNTPTTRGRQYFNDGTPMGINFVIDNENGATPNIGVTGDGRVIFTWSLGGDVQASIWDPRSDLIQSFFYDDPELNFVDGNIIWGGVGASFIVGNRGQTTADHFIGREGDDIIIVREGDNILEGNGGDDRLLGGNGDDRMSGGAGDDVFSYDASRVNDGPGADVLDGGSGIDSIEIDFRSGGSIDLINAGTEWTGLERIVFRTSDDDESGNNILVVDGDELIDGFTSGLHIFGGDSDEARSDFRIFMGTNTELSLSSTVFSDWTDGFDFISVIGTDSVDVVEGTSSGDFIRVGEGRDDVDGLGGDDVIEGGPGGDILRGGTGIDTLSYVRSSAGVTIDLSNSTAEGGEAQGDAFFQFENVSGTSSADRLTGDGFGNVLRGGFGDDSLVGSASSGMMDTAGAQVYRIYQATLDRAPDTGGFAGWVDRLETGERTVQQVVTGFVASTEFQNVYGSLDDTDFVTLLYDNVLEREPDQAGLNGWLQRMSNGTTRESVVTGFSESNEFKFATNVEAGAYAAALDSREQSGFMDDVFRLYQTTLDRAPDAAGLDGWSARLADGQSYVSIAAGFTNSLEFTNTYGNLGNGAFVEQLYRNVLDREADQAGLEGWLSRLDNGDTREDVVRGFAQSNEFIGNTAEAFDAYMRSSLGDVLYGGGDDDMLYAGTTSDTMLFYPDEHGTDTVLQIDTWDTLRFEYFGYDEAADVLENMTVSGPDVRFSDFGVQIVFVDTDLATLREVDYLFLL